DVDQRVFEDKKIFVAAIACVPAEEAKATFSEPRRDVVLREVDVVVVGDDRDFWLRAALGPVEPLTGIAARTGASAGGGSEADEFAGDLGHDLLDEGEARLNQARRAVADGRRQRNTGCRR